MEPLKSESLARRIPEDTIHDPVEWAARALRLRSIRRLLRMTQREFAAKMGLSTTNYGMHESGYVYPGNTKMILAERLLEDYNREIVAKRALANVDLDEDTRTSVLRLYVTGTDPEAIARLLSVDPRVVQLAIAGIDEEEEDSDD